MGTSKPSTATGAAEPGYCESGECAGVACPSVVQLRLRARWQKALFVLVVAIPSSLFSLKSAEIAVAAICDASGSVRQLRRAVAADATNPEVYQRLGQSIFYRFEGSDQNQGLENLRRAATLGPNRSLCWTDLAVACESANDHSCAEAAFARALHLSPMRPRIHWLAANYYLSGDERSGALSELRAALTLSPAYSAPIFELCKRAHIDPGVVDTQVLPAERDPALRLMYAEFLVREHQIEPAARVWSEVVASRRLFPFVLAEPYVEDLIEQGEYARAFTAWQDLQQSGIVGESARDGTSLVFNGGFEEDSLNAGFDWHYRQPAYLSLDFADSGAYEGRRCLRLGFVGGHNEEYEPIFEIVPVVPNQRYVLTAFVRSERITSDSGLRLRVMDPAHPSDLDASSEPTLGTTAWHAVRVTFFAGSQTKAVRISVWRPRSRNFPGQISGSAWIDRVSLRAAAQPIS